MILPASYQSGFAPRDGRPLYPSLWKGCSFAAAPCLGPTGLTLRDWSGFANHGTFANLTASAVWQPTFGKYSIAFSGATSEAVTGSVGSVTSAMRPLTLSWWYRGSTVSAARHWIYHNNNVSSNPDIGLTIERVSDTSHSLGLYSGAYTYSSQFAWDLNLHHYAITWLADNTVTFFRDGVQMSSSTRTAGGVADTTWQMSRLGSGAGVGGFSMTGNLVEFWKHKRSLSAAEIKLFAMRPGIAFEMSPRRRSSSAVQFNRRRRLLVGAGS